MTEKEPARRRGRPWTAKDARECPALRKAGVSVKTLAQRFGRSVSAVTALLSCCGVSLRIRPSDRRIREAVLAGASAPELAASVGVSLRTAYRLLAVQRGRAGLSDDGLARLGAGVRRRSREAASRLGWPEADSPREARFLSAISSGRWTPSREARARVGLSRNTAFLAFRRLAARGIVEARGNGISREYRIAPALLARRESA